MNRSLLELLAGEIDAFDCRLKPLDFVLAAAVLVAVVEVDFLVVLVGLIGGRDFSI